MHISTISIGYAVPGEDFTASVHSVFQSALNLRVKGNDHLLTLVASGEGDLPQGIRLDVPEDFSFREFRLGKLVICRNGILRFERDSLTVQLSGARRWTCDLPAAGRTGSPNYSSAWRFVWEALNERQRLSGAEIRAEELFQETERTGVPGRAGKAVRELVKSTQQYDLNTSAVQALIGLGSGLTPGGDDLLVGYLAGLWCTVQGKSERVQILTSLGQAILSLSSQTNDISRTYLYHAVQGQVSSRLADLAEAIARGSSPERLGVVAEAAFQVGHTSGLDTVTGMLIGMAVWEFPTGWAL